MSRPAPRWHDVRAVFADLAITTFAVEPERLRTHLPDDCVPQVFALHDGRRALVSTVSFRARRFALHALPGLGPSFSQVNYRTYVTAGGGPCVFFFGSVAPLAITLLPRYLWRLPWHRGRITLDADWREDACTRYAMTQRSPWGGAELRAVPGPTLSALDGFASLEDGLVALTHPLVGYCQRQDGGRAIYRVWHDRLVMSPMDAEKARFEVLENLGLIAPGDRPHSVLVCREAEFVSRLDFRVRGFGGREPPAS
jgi:hypothetical protein